MVAAPLSAFARRQALQTQSSEVGRLIETQSAPNEQVTEAARITASPKKKRKRGNISEIASSVPVPAFETLDVQDASEQASDKALESTDTSDVEGILEDDLSNSDTHVLTETPARVLSTLSFAKSSTLGDNDTTWTLRLHPDDSLAILGQYDLWVRSGAVSILGAVVHASSKLHRVYAPSIHSIPSIRPVLNPFGSGNPPCELSIISCGSRLRMLNQMAPKFGRIWNAGSKARDKRRSFVNVQISTEDVYKRPLRLLELASDWQVMASRLLSTEHKVDVMVCGPKGSGKSTFCRMMVNALLSKNSPKQGITENQSETNCVAFLDLDPGQPEYSPPGEIVLHRLRTCNLGPPFSHPTSNGGDSVIKAHHFGHLSPKEDPEHYYRCVLDLFSCYQSSFTRNGPCPLVVNCSGWIQGSGLELMAKLVDEFRFFDMVYTSTTGPEEVIEALSEAANMSETNLHQLTSRAPEINTRTAADLRMMQTLSYFHLDEPEGSNLRWNESPLTSIPPIVVHYDGPRQGIAAVMVLGDSQAPEFLESILEGCVVGVVAVDEDIFAEEENNPYSDLPNGDETHMDTGRNSLTNDDPPDTGNNIYETASVDTDIFPSQRPPRHIRRTLSGLPYFASHHHTTSPLPPFHSQSLGQALIRSINPQTRTFHLSTPVPSTTIAHITQQKQQKIVLVRGTLDIPTWAYSEQLEYEKVRRRRREKVLGEKVESGGEETRTWAKEQPWAEVVEGGRSGSGRVRRVRRDIRYRGQREGGISE